MSLVKGMHADRVDDAKPVAAGSTRDTLIHTRIRTNIHTQRLLSWSSLPES
jgi:hypothetical protein